MTDPDSARLPAARVHVGRWLAAAAVGALLVWAALNAVGDPGSSVDAGTSTDAVPVESDPAIDFSVDLIGGGTFTLSEHLMTDGRPVVLNFWASWCGPCRAEMPDFDEVARQKPSVLFVGIAVADVPDAALRFATEIAVSYPLGIDKTETIAAKYPFIGLPTTWLIDRDGQIVRKFTGQIRKPDLIEFLAVDLGV